MSGERDLTTIVAQALELAPELREAYLDETCGDRPDVRREVESLIAVARDSRGRLESPAARIDVTSNPHMEAESLAPGVRLGPYEIVSEIGAGGMGVVHRAHQIKPVERDVALKAIKPGMDTRTVLARFDLERRTLARLAHPNIATLLDAGTTPMGRPFLVMELVEGDPITTFASDRGLSAKERIRLALEALDAVRHAHRRGVLHRDLKASNVLVADMDGRAIVKIIDFGISKLLEPDETDASLTQTGDGHSPGTPRSMAPEQRLRRGGADVRTDIYAFGVLLADLLADAPAARPAREVAMTLPGDLRWVTLRCLEDAPEDRYQTVDDLIEDLNRALRLEPTIAGPPGLGRRVRVAWRRHRVPVVVTMIVVVSLATGLIMAIAARQEARIEARRATVANVFLSDLFLRLDPAIARTKDTTLLREMLDDAAARVDVELGDEPEAEAVAQGAIGRGYAMIGESSLAVPHLRRAIELTPTQRGRPGDGRRELQTRLMGALKDQGELDEAAAIGLAVYEDFVASRGPDDPLSLSAANNLATVLMQQRRYAEAEPLLRSILAAKENSPDVDDSSILLSQSNLATTLSALGRHDEALPIRESILIAVEQEFGADHPRTFAALNNVAVSLERTGTDPARALAIRRRALALAKAIHGPRHPNTLIARNNLAMLLAGRGQHADAEPLFCQSVEDMIATVGETHFMTVATRKNLADSLLAMNRAEEATIIAEAAWHGAKDGLDADHPLQGLTLLTYVDALAATGETANALKILETALESVSKNEGPTPDWRSDAEQRRAELVQSLK